MENDATTAPTLTTLLEVRPPALPETATVMTVLVELPPGDPGSPPHRHPGPVFGYTTEGELRYEIPWRPVTVCGPGRPMVAPVGEDELAALARDAA